MVKIKILSVLLLCALALSLLGCNGNTVPEETKATDKEEIIKNAEACLKIGGRFENLLMDETSAYFYGFAAAEVSSFRLAVEKLLWLKGEGDSFADLAADSRYTDWDTIAEMCFACPYPYYFEGLIYDVQGESEEANDAYSKASIMENFPDEGLNFYYLKDESVSDLYSLRDELRAVENKIYKEYTPVIYGCERSVYAACPEYLLLDAYELLEKENYESAMISARYAVRENPKIEESWVVAVTAAMYADQPHQAAMWLEEGSKYFPESEALLVLRKSLTDLSAQASSEGGENQ